MTFHNRLPYKQKDPVRLLVLWYEQIVVCIVVCVLQHDENESPFCLKAEVKKIVGPRAPESINDRSPIRVWSRDLVSLKAHNLRRLRRGPIRDRSSISLWNRDSVNLNAPHLQPKFLPDQLHILQDMQTKPESFREHLLFLCVIVGLLVEEVACVEPPLQK